MARVRNTNYRAEADTDFFWATADDDHFDRDDVDISNQALDRHDHGSGRGLPVARTGANSVSTTSIQDDSVIADTKIPVLTLDPAQVPTDNVDRLSVLLGQLANRIKIGFGTTNWYDTPPVALTGKVTKAGDQMSGTLTNYVDTGGINLTLWQRANFIAGTAVAISGTKVPAYAWYREGISAVAMYHAQSGNGRLWIVDHNGLTGQVLTTMDNGASGVIDAGRLQGLGPGNALNNIPISNGVECNQLFATYAKYLSTVYGNITIGNAAFNIAVNNSVQSIGLYAQYAAAVIDQSNGVPYSISNAANALPISNSVQCTGLWAQFATNLIINGVGIFPAGNAANNIPINNGGLNVGLVASAVGTLDEAGIRALVASGSRVSSTYAGNGGASRTISTGFTPSLVVLQDISQVNKIWVLQTAGGCVQITGAGLAQNTNVKITSGGFLVHSGANDANQNSPATTYAYTAFA